MRSSLFSQNIIQLCMDIASTPQPRVTAYTSAPERGFQKCHSSPLYFSSLSSAFFQFFLRFQLSKTNKSSHMLLRTPHVPKASEPPTRPPGSCNSICPFQNCQLSWWTLANLFTCFQLFRSLVTFDSKFFPNPRRFFFLMGDS